MSNNSTATERKRRIAHLVARYQRAPSAVEHERLLLLIEEEYGQLAAEFFDQEGSLPLVSCTGPGNYPYPMRQDESTLFAMSSLICSIVTASVVYWGSASIISSTLAVLIGAVSGLTVWFSISPVVSRLFPPKNLLERQRLVQEFAALEERHQAKAEVEAMKARQARLPSYSR